MSVTIRPITPALQAVVFEVTDYEGDSGGVGGWETIPRPRNTTAAAWVGEPERTYVLPVILDGVDALGPGVDRVVEREIAAVTSWGKKHPTTGEPPILQVTGARRVSTVDRWVLQDIEWGEYDVDARNQVVQQYLTLTLLRFEAPALVKGAAARSRAASPSKTKNKNKGKGKNKKGKNKRKNKGRGRR